MGSIYHYEVALIVSAHMCASFCSVVLWTAISTMGESLGAATQLLGYIFGIYLTVLTGGVFVRNPILSLILGDSRKVCHDTHSTPL
jgi:hypothetical protein